MFTQCPKCQSVFMVSDKDIRAHEGLVRCGNCYSVFNSSWNLTDDPRTELTDSSGINENKGQPSSSGSGFTFNLVGNGSNSPPFNAELPDPPTEASSESESQTDKGTNDSTDQLPDDDLEPFPEPEIESEQAEVAEPDESGKKDSLLYFDSDEGGDDEVVEDKSILSGAIKDASILQTATFISTPLPPDEDQDLLVTDNNAHDASPLSMSEDSMWPGSELSYEENGNDIELPVLDLDESETVSIVADDTESISKLPDFFNVDAAPDDDLVEGLGDPLLFNTPSGQDEDLSEQQNEELANIETTPLEPYLAPVDDEDNTDESAYSDTSENGLIADEAADSDQADELLPLSSELLPGLNDDELSLGNEKDAVDDSVFITSEEEEIDDAYVPISVKTAESDELFHKLDEFPEPGELSKLNYEDTMEINAMLEAANVSKEEIDSAILSAESSTGDDIVEEIMLSSDDAVNPEDVEFLTNREQDDQAAEDDAESKKKDKSSVSFVKKLLPLSWGAKKGWVEPAVLDTEETQLIQHLNRGKNKAGLPGWVARYSSLAAVTLLILTLIGQIGYFYMDKLVRIKPLQPILEVGCMVAGCTVPSIQNTADIEQLSSRMAPLAGSDGGFKVDSILVNRGIGSQAYPALELTLTDRAGNIISRRVVTPDKYLAEKEPVEMKPNAAVDISIRFRTPSIRVDGFELRPVSQNWLERSVQRN